MTSLTKHRKTSLTPSLQLATDDDGLAAELTGTLVDELPVHARDGGYVCAGFSPELDEYRRLRDDARKVIAQLQTSYATATGVKSLKIRHNNVLGYFVEVTQQNAAVLTGGEHAETFIHRQTMANAMRFTTTELAELEARISMAADRALELELEIFSQLVERIRAGTQLITALADAIAGLDVSAGLAQLAGEQRYCRPQIDTTCQFKIIEGRHPVVEAALLSGQSGQSGQFIPNDCNLSAGAANSGKIWLLTGPNMAGKSTCSASERHCRASGTDGVVRTGTRSPHWHHRPAVQPCWRGR